MTGIIILVVVVLLVIWGVSIYNNLVKLRNNRENAFANIDVQLKQRHDLVPQLVATVKGYADHEKEVFMRVTEARSASNLFAGMFGFKKEPMFEIPTEQRTEFDKAPEVKF